MKPQGFHQRFQLKGKWFSQAGKNWTSLWRKHLLGVAGVKVIPTASHLLAARPRTKPSTTYFREKNVLQKEHHRELVSNPLKISWSRLQPCRRHFQSIARAHYQEPATPIISLCNGIFTDQSIFRYFSREKGHFQSTWARFCEDKTMRPHVNMATLFRDVNSSPCLWLQLVTKVPAEVWIRDKFKLK